LRRGLLTTVFQNMTQSKMRGANEIRYDRLENHLLKNKPFSKTILQDVMDAFYQTRGSFKSVYKTKGIFMFHFYYMFMKIDRIRACCCICRRKQKVSKRRGSDNMKRSKSEEKDGGSKWDRIFDRRHKVIINSRARFLNELDAKTILEAVRFCKFLFHNMGPSEKVLLNFQKTAIITQNVDEMPSRWFKQLATIHNKSRVVRLIGQL